MGFVVAILVVAFIVSAILTSGYRSEVDDKFKSITERLRRTESELDALRRAHVSLVTQLERQKGAPVSQTVVTEAPEPLANARVIVVDTPPAAEPETKAPKRDDARMSTPPAPVFASMPSRQSTVRETSGVPPQAFAGSPGQRSVTRIVAPMRPPQKPLIERLRSLFDLEEKLGANYLAKLGASSVVIGVALFLIHQFGGTPAGKVVIGFLGSALGLGGGLWLERKEWYRLFARSLMGGGWALLYFTTYAMYHVAAARVLSSQVLDLVLMLAVAACMVTHTLRYRSQVVTGLAFMLGFLTVTISHNDVYSLSAGAVLALALVVITARLRWFELEVFGLLGAYINHFYWLYPYVSDHRLSPKLFAPSTALLVFYWAVFRGSYVLRKITNTNEESVSTVAALLNTTLLLGLMKYQSLHPEWAFYALIAFGTIELLLGQLPITRRRRTEFLILTTVGVTLIIAAFPFRYADATLSLTWLVLSQLLLVAGILTREVHFRRMGILAAMAAAAVIAYQAGVARQWDLVVKAPGAHETLVFAIAALLFYLDAHLVRWLWTERITSTLERGGLRVLSYVAFAMTLSAVAVAWDLKWFAIASAVLALTFAFLAVWLRDHEFLVQGPLYSLSAIVTVLKLNTWTVEQNFHVTFRAIAYIVVAALLYVAAFFHGRTANDEADDIRGAHTWMASILLGVLIWFEVPAPWIAVAWMAFALVLMAASRLLRVPSLNLQANAATIAAIIRVALFNMPATGLYHHDALRLTTVLAVTVALYATARWAETKEFTWTRGFSHVHTVAATALLSVLAWYELQPMSVVPAWTAYGLLLFEAGVVLGSRSLRAQGYVVLTTAFVRIFFVNLNAAGASWLSPRIYTVLPLAIALYYVYTRVLISRDAVDEQTEIKLADFATYFAAMIVASLLRFEVAQDWVAASWAALAVLLIVAAVVAKRTAFAYQAIILAGAVIVRGLMYNLAERTALAGNYVELLPVGVAVLLTLCALPFAFHLRKHPSGDEAKAAPRALVVASRHPEQFFFFIPVALATVLLWIELPSFRTMAWGIEGMLVFLVALWAGERSFRWTGLGLLLMCIGKIVAVDAWSMEPRDRYLTLIVVGLVLLTVSFLYNRYREALRKLL
jgi:hypothetical protein